MAITTQEGALAAMLRGDNCHLTGRAGTGKSETVRRFREGSPHPVSVTASTGIAALNIRGLTLHSFCGIGLGPNPGQRFGDFYEFLESRPGFWRASDRIRACRALVIDEVSMLTGSTFDAVNSLFRRVRMDARPFGGVQVIAVGDFLQLAPVRRDSSTRYDWCFESRAWREAGFTNIRLERVWRQDDPEFVRCLDDCRRGTLSTESKRLLRGRVIDFPDDDIPRLFTHNRQVDHWNRLMLDRLPGQDVVSHAEVVGPPGQVKFLCRNSITPQSLTLREGARVMMTANLNDASGNRVFVNGETGTVTRLRRSPSIGIEVLLDRGRIVPVERQTWHYDWQDPQSASFTQFPLKPAYAMTIHKAQGLTLDRGLVDIRQATEPGQAYVALSRMRSIDGVYLAAWFKGFSFSGRALQFYEGLS